ncbi:D123-domain-containing protein [Scleroderma yunnanense]
MSSADGTFPLLSPDYILAFQFSNWYPLFARFSPKSTIIRPLGKDFKDYLDSDGVFVPEGSEDIDVERSLPDDDDDTHSTLSDGVKFSFPELDERIRRAITEYGAVFPKLNFSSPRDASWVLPASSPLKCTSPADVYLLLKSSDFITHDISIERVFDGCNTNDLPAYELELVLRKWYPVDRSREVRCFVRNDTLLGITQRDPNFYDFMVNPDTQSTIQSTVHKFWEENIKPNWPLAQKDYIFDFLLTRDLSRGHILDFSPYAPHTDSLLFTYEDLRELCNAVREFRRGEVAVSLPELRVIDSPLHPAALSNVPMHQHNMVPIEALSLSQGRNIIEFGEVWQDEVRRAMQDED